LNTLERLSAERRIAVLGDVEEPRGTQGLIYKALGRRLAKSCDRVLFVGGKKAFASLRAGATDEGFPSGALTYARIDPPAIAQMLQDELLPGDVVLLKGRSTQHLERIALILSGETVTCSEPFCAKRQHCGSCPLR